VNSEKVVSVVFRRTSKVVASSIQEARSRAVNEFLGESNGSAEGVLKRMEIIVTEDVNG
jgi:hypothetical protein